MFCQPIDIGIDLADNSTQDIPNMEGYPLRSLGNAIQYIETLLKIGICTVMVRMDAPSTYKDKHVLLKKQASLVQSLRTAFAPTNLRIIVDPFSIALNADKTWGIQSKGRLDYLRTAELFSFLTQSFAEAGADYILTLGRFEREVEIATRTIAALSSTMLVSSFSTNTETTNAYVYNCQQPYAVTGQKILVSNYDEMTFRALLDIYEGTHLVVVKPAENVHVLEKLAALLTHPELLENFLRSDSVKAMVDQANHLRKAYADMLSGSSVFTLRMRSVSLASYAISGTYYMDRQILKRKGQAFLKSLLYERYVTTAAVIVAHGEPLIIDRNAGWFWMS